MWFPELGKADVRLFRNTRKESSLVSQRKFFVSARNVPESREPENRPLVSVSFFDPLGPDFSSFF